jgi:uncharacterized OsmC-like protein
MAIVTVHAGASGQPTEVTFDESEADGDPGPSPYGYVLLGLGA